MSYRFERGEAIPKEIRRIAAEQIDSALEKLNGKAAARDEAVHEARKCIKKLRALLRLVEKELGEVFETENTRLRDAGRVLSAFRDAATMVQTFDEVREKRGKELSTEGADAIRAGLLAHKSRSERRDNLKAVLESTAKELRAAKSRSKRWPLQNDGFGAIAGGVKRAFRRGRKAMDEAHRNPSPETFHAWRRRVKDHWYHVRLLNKVWPEVMDGYEASLKSLEDKLGMDHNLNVLADKLKSEPEFFATPEQIEAAVNAIAGLQKELQQESREIGLRVYAEKPRALARRLEAYWSAWA